MTGGRGRGDARVLSTPRSPLATATNVISFLRYRLNTRFARFVKVPELMTVFRQVADIQTAEMLKLPVPALKGDRPRIVSAPATPELKAFVFSLAKRAEKLKKGHVYPTVDNMLKITGEGRKAALDMRLVRGWSPEHPESKVNQALREIAAVWRDTKSDRLYSYRDSGSLRHCLFGAFQAYWSRLQLSSLVPSGLPDFAGSLPSIQLPDTRAVAPLFLSSASYPMKTVRRFILTSLFVTWHLR